MEFQFQNAKEHLNLKSELKVMKVRIGHYPRIMSIIRNIIV